MVGVFLLGFLTRALQPRNILELHLILQSYYFSNFHVRTMSPADRLIVTEVFKCRDEICELVAKLDRTLSSNKFEYNEKAR